MAVNFNPSARGLSTAKKPCNPRGSETGWASCRAVFDAASQSLPSGVSSSFLSSSFSAYFSCGVLLENIFLKGWELQEKPSVAVSSSTIKIFFIDVFNGAKKKPENVKQGEIS